MPLEASPTPANGRGAGGTGIAPAPAPALDISWGRAEAGLVKRPDSGTDWAAPTAGQGRAGLWGAGALLWPGWAGLAEEADMFLLLARDPLASFLKHLLSQENTIILFSCRHGMAVSQARYAKKDTRQNEQKCLTLQTIRWTLAG